MNVAKRLTKLESQLVDSENQALNIMVVAFCKPGETNMPITHLYTEQGVDDCFMSDDESENEFHDRAIASIRLSRGINENHALMVFGDRKTVQTYKI